jgi:DNA-binding PadR family transcriptional regulator
MPSRSSVGSRALSPLAVVVLALLLEAPMHAYRMQQLIKGRHKDEVVNVAQRNSIYQAIDRLRRAELIAVRGTAKDAGRPERTVYEITAPGARAARDWLRNSLANPATEFPVFPAALAFLPLLPVDDVIERLAHRIEALADRLRRIDGELAAPEGPPRLLLVETEYQRALVLAERDWLLGLLGELRSGALSWSTTQFRHWLPGDPEAAGWTGAVDGSRAVGSGMVDGSGAGALEAQRDRDGAGLETQ